MSISYTGTFLTGVTSLVHWSDWRYDNGKYRGHFGTAKVIGFHEYSLFTMKIRHHGITSQLPWLCIIFVVVFSPYNTYCGWHYWCWTSQSNATRTSSSEHPILSRKHSAGDIVYVNAPDFWANKWQQPQPFQCGGKKGAATTPDAVPQLPYLSMQKTHEIRGTKTCGYVLPRRHTAYASICRNKNGHITKLNTFTNSYK